MKKLYSVFTIALAVFLISCNRPNLPVLETGGITPMPDEWIDEDTGHRMKRLTGPEGNNRSFYFHNDPFIKGENGDDDRMVYYGNVPENKDDRDFTPRGKNQLYIMNLRTLETKQLTNHPARIRGEIVGKKKKRVYYQSNDSIFSTDIETQKTTLHFVFPEDVSGGITTVNADETLLGGVISNKEKQELLRKYPMKGDFFTRIFEARIPHSLISIDLDNGTMQEIFSDTAWLNHVQFSPSDPDLLMFCHEGPWHKLDRIWSIDIKKKEPRMMHKRTVHREIAGHEFFSRDGEIIWFDLQIPRGETFYLAGADLESGEEKRYGLKRDEWSVHFNISHDQKLFAGDGGDSTSVAKAPDGKWIYLFHPEGDSLRSEKLVNMRQHDYDLEPNVHFSPDGKWIIFRANFEGSSQIYAVEI